MGLHRRATIQVTPDVTGFNISAINGHGAAL